MSLLQHHSLEMTGKDVPELEEATPLIPAGTRINVTFLSSEDLTTRLEAATAVKAAGLIPVPHIAARRLTGVRELRTILAALREADVSEHVFVVGGDPQQPMGPYASALDVIRTGLLPEYGVREVSISGYPEGHPDISDEELWSALKGKVAALAQQGLGASVITQFGFDEAPIVSWIEHVRAQGIDAPIRIGVPGPAGVTRLLGFARRFGVASSAGIVKKYGFSLTNLIGSAGPDRLIGALTDAVDPARHGEVLLHFYTFGGVAATARWIREYTTAPATPRRRHTFTTR
ncbi:MAG: methylenetetrahydrofolate reductase [Microbacterium sp.]|uniref:methylenetetrahydrofolate reductase n=1 Tax=Microbacterium sp. TaxID=51671 RepID=UPI002621FACB|nr:methylenetetrahydrofolate reductase [Microbacterium sp.]MCX6503001.1 methylenetetrahydrofolate reductase [Microbacterium sp.]